MEEMIVKWIRETLFEIGKAKLCQNLHRMAEMENLGRALREMRHKLLDSLY